MLSNNTCILDFTFHVSLKTQYRKCEYGYQNTNVISLGGMKEKKSSQKMGTRR